MSDVETEEPEAEQEEFPCYQCEFVASTKAGLGSHARVHRWENIEAAPKPEPEPEPAPKPSGVMFTCERYPKLVIAPNGRRLAQFSDGELITDNKRVIDVCRSLPEVEEVTR